MQILKVAFIRTQREKDNERDIRKVFAYQQSTSQCVGVVVYDDPHTHALCLNENLKSRICINTAGDRSIRQQ